jgi:hypothetical protein
MNLPMIKSQEEALRLASEHGDSFYVSAFALQHWLSQLSIRAVTDYSTVTDPYYRPMQTGQAWAAFLALFPVTDDECSPLISTLMRFSECENPLSHLLLSALAPIYLEHGFYGDYLGPKAPNYSDDPASFGRLARESIQRLCDWLDAVVHFQTHALWHKVPACFDPDPEKSRLAAERLSQPYIAQMDDPALVRPYLPTPAASAADSAPERPWPFPRLDECIIALWPMVKLHHWSFAALHKVLSQAGAQPGAPPLKDSRALQTYCAASLGLHTPAQKANGADPPGYSLSLYLCQPRRSSPPIGQAPWS